MMLVEGAVISSLDFNLSPSMYHLCLRCRRDCSFNLLWVKKKKEKKKGGGGGGGGGGVGGGGGAAA